MRRVETGAEDKGVDRGEEEEKNPGALSEMAVGDAVEARSSVTFVPDSGQDVLGGNGDLEGVVREKGVVVAGLKVRGAKEAVDCRRGRMKRVGRAGVKVVCRCCAKEFAMSRSVVRGWSWRRRG